MIALLSALLLAPPADTTAQLHVYRYWRAPDITNVVCFVSVPLAELTYAEDAEERSRVARYEIGLTILDASGNVLVQEDWGNRVRVGMGEVPSSSQAVENMSFDLKPGEYRLAVEVRDSVSGQSTRLEEVIDATGERPLIGDLLLAHSIDRVPEGGEAPAGSLLRHGLAIAPNLTGTLPADGALVQVYTEVYPPQTAEGEDVADVQILLAAEETPDLQQEAPPVQKRYPPGGGLELVRVPVEGLAPGPYRVGVRVAFPDTAVTAYQRFELSAPRVAAVGPARTDLFPSHSEAQLDSLYLKVDYIATPRERRMFKGLSAEGKRRFMEEFWSRRDPIAGDPNEAYQEYMDRVEYANREFDFAGNPGEGWATARGRVWVMQGAPFERFTRPTTGPVGEGLRVRTGERMYEVWRYAGSRNDVFVFYDQTGWGNFHQVYATHPEEFTETGWQRYFDQQTIELILSMGSGRNR
ncbi:MAG: GWxTD domain-containing protein [Gemmatimonadota bacterium]